MLSDKSGIKYRDRIKGFVNEVHSVGHHVADLEVRKAALKRSTKEFSVLAQVFQTTNSSYVDAVSQLIVHQVSKNDVAPDTGKALSIEQGGRNFQSEKHCYYCKRKGRLANECFYNSNSPEY